MATINSGQVHLEVANLINERKDARTLAKYQSQVITQLERQLDFYESLLASTHPELGPYPLSEPKDNENGIWVGTWLSTKTSRSVLGPAETAWSKQENQRALAMLDVAILGGRTKEKIWARILKAVILRSCGLKPEALAESEQAAEIASGKRYHDLTGMAQFQRGICFFHLEQYAEASLCFSLAAFTRNYGEQVHVWKQMAEEMRQLYPIGDERRYIAENFKEY